MTHFWVFALEYVIQLPVLALVAFTPSGFTKIQIADLDLFNYCDVM